MKILRVFNNNVVLASDEQGQDVIATGRGLGFQARPGDLVDETKLFRVFIPMDGRDSDHMAQLLSDISADHLYIIGNALKEICASERMQASPTLVVALADHLQFALKRIETEMVVEYPLEAEVRHLYSREYAQARHLLEIFNRHLPTPLPDSEAVAISLHLVNAGFSSGDLSQTYQMTGVIQQMLSVVEATWGMSFDPSSVHVARFITHLRYLFVRITQHRQLVSDHSILAQTIQETYPQAFQCAQHLGAIMELRLGAALTDDELSYLTLHVARLAFDK
ncbi:PRD domain-containing protein [Trueperella sp. LYQ143]|uniref:PRD domain-containing protein n=1 Tax=unclassified Trueperella TaxID=2630174 RepID=UPI003983B912